MNPEVKAKWVAALRSGEYKQTKGALARVRQTVTRYCCLGVLCQIAVDEGVISAPSWASAAHETLTFDNQALLLPATVARWAGLGADNDPRVDHGHLKRRLLSAVNDEGVAFDDIADMIEASL